MDKTPNSKLKRLTCKKTQDLPEDNVISQSSQKCPTSTPVKTNAVDSENEDSYSSSGYTQDYNENVAVIWDWNSPQAKHQQKRKKKLSTSRLSPKTVVKRHPSNNNQQQVFEKLREELLELRKQIAVPDNETSLVLSPQEEETFKTDAASGSALSSLVQNEDNYNGEQDFEEIFNDCLDEQLVLCSQQVEEVISREVCDRKPSTMLLAENKLQSSIVKCVNSDTNKTQTRVDVAENTFHSSSTKCVNNSKLNKLQFNIESCQKLDDSLDRIFETIEDKDIELLTQSAKSNTVVNSYNRNNTIKRTHSDMQLQIMKNQAMSDNNRKFEFVRTQSFESSEIIRKEGCISLKTMQEIERKRQEALAKLESKRKKGGKVSPSQCSPDEIEQKRLQAVAKLARKQEQEIERKRIEALKRLELSKLKRTVGTRNTLSKRL